MRPSSEPIAPDQFGSYEVYERLGLGGMATVCRAKKRGPAGFERSVALKRMLSHLSEDQTFVESFIREAKVSSLLVHPNIAQVYDFGRINGVYYIAMELVPGFDLRKLLRYANRANESIPLNVVLSILGEMCDALEYAHTCLDENGTPLHIVHRDISPSNIIVAHTGHTKVIDFGIAKANSRQLHTESGQVKGKLGYMSPEAALGMQIGPVSDVFSMGVVAWELVTASPLFSARSDFETMRKIREAEVPPPSTHNPACPRELDQLILHALERDNERRLASASQFRRGIDSIAAREGIQTGPRIVAEWVRQFIQPDDFLRPSQPVQREAPTSVLRPSKQAVLQRSQDEIMLAAEIWGEDAGPNSIAGGPDFSIANPRAIPPQVSAIGATVQYTTPSHPLPLSAPPPSGQYPSAGPYMPAPMQQIMPYAVPQQPPRKTNRVGIILLIGLALVAAVLVVILVSKKDEPKQIAAGDTQTQTPTQTQTTPPPAAPPVAQPPQPPTTQPATPQTSPSPSPTTSTPTPVTPTPAPIDTKPSPHVRPHDKTHPQPHHVEEAPPPTPTPPTPTPTPPPVIVETPPPAKPTPTPVDPPKPTRTPVVAATAVSKISGELPVLHGDHDGDVLVKMCIDDAGKVTSVKIVRASPDMPTDLANALQSWRYKPYLKDGKAEPVCFALSLRVVVKNEN